jgi:hypothetical protein
MKRSRLAPHFVVRYACRLAIAARLFFSCPESVRVERRDRRVGDVRRIEGVERWAARLLHAGRLVFPPRLVRGDFPGLRGTDLAAEHLHP